MAAAKAGTPAASAANPAEADMQRLRIDPRPGHAEKLESIGLSFHGWDDYWCEEVCYRFSAEQIDLLEARTAKLHAMCLNAVDHVIRHKRLGELDIPAIYWQAIETSFARREFSLYGRFDLAYDGKNEPRLLEYNADTPTSLLESAVAQWYWMKEKFPAHDQFNSLHERLVERWKHMDRKDGRIYFASLAGNEEDWVCVHYLMDTARQAGFDVRHIDVENLGWDANTATFVDEDNAPIGTLFKLYPWEWMMHETFGPMTTACNTRFVEPIWKSVLSCKAILPILWELYPDHPNLLPAFFVPGQLTSYAKKPFFSREGANIVLVEEGKVVAEDDGPYGHGRFIYQQLHRLPDFDGNYPVIGSWIVGDEPAGICLREDALLVTTNMSHFIPHYFVASPGSAPAARA
jgi:glutathionylspermidine synthase